MLPAAWALVVTAILGAALANLSWPFVDLYSFLYRASSSTWRETVVNAFAGGVEYRPLMIIGVKLAHQLVGLRLWPYQVLLILQFAALLVCVIWLFRPNTRRRAAAACVALACIAGLHSSRVLFAFAPSINAHSLTSVLLMAMVLLALAPRSRARELAFLPLTLAALLLLESGGLIVAVTLVLWRTGAPGASGRAVACTLIGAAIYTAVRFGLGNQVAAATYTETGLGFGDVGPARLGEIFANAPWLLWIYNVAASLLTVLVSEPRAGKYHFVESLLHGHVPIWMYIHVITSMVTTGVISYGLWTRQLVPRDRQIAAVGLTLLGVGSALGFLYTRDRIALWAGIGYAMLVYVAIAALLEDRAGRSEGRSLSGTSVLVVSLSIVAAGWLIRTGEAYVHLRDAAWENYLEWTVRYEELGGFSRPQTDMLQLLRTAALAQPPADPRHDPVWTYTVFEREFDRLPDP
jgi:hypothetical protein